MSTYCVADLHGCYSIWKQIKNFLKEDDTLYILGDCIDRQEGGLAILTEALADPRCIVLCGNHEDMMADALEEELEYGYSDYWIWRWFSNGGQYTYEDWNEAGRDFSWISRIRALPLWAEYINQEGNKIIMSHSGACYYCDGHKINIDSGGCWTGHVCMLDLDTFDEHIFEV